LHSHGHADQHCRLIQEIKAKKMNKMASAVCFKTINSGSIFLFVMQIKHTYFSVVTYCVMYVFIFNMPFCMLLGAHDM